MPHPARIDPQDIIAEARALLENGGIEGVTMRALARRLGVSAPSLYFHVESRDDLLREITIAGLRELGDVLDSAFWSRDEPAIRAERMARVYIAFAEQNPQLFALLFGPSDEARRVGESLGEAASQSVLALSAEIAGESRALDLAASIWSMVHGYTLLRIADRFDMNPDHEASFFWGLRQIVRGAAVAEAQAAGLTSGAA